MPTNVAHMLICNKAVKVLQGGGGQSSDMRIWTFFVIIVLMFTAAEIAKGEEKGKMSREISCLQKPEVGSGTARR